MGERGWGVEGGGIEEISEYKALVFCSNYMHYKAHVHVYCCVTFTVQVNVYEYQPVSERKWRGREEEREG